MEYKILANDCKMPVLGIGTWKMGGSQEKDTKNDKHDIAAIKTALKLGATYIDTSENYGAGHAEELVWRATKNFNKNRVFISTKVGKENLRFDDVIKSAKGSMRRLGTKQIDLYLIHVNNPDIPLKQTMKAMDFLVSKRLVRFIGVSNFSLDLMKEACEYSEHAIAANQIEYNLITRNNGQFCLDVEKKVIPFCQKNGIMVIAYRPLAKGYLAKPGIELLDKMAEKYKKSQAQIALNWLIQKKHVIAIPKSSIKEHVTENIGSIGWKIDKKDSKKLDRLKISN